MSILYPVPSSGDVYFCIDPVSRNPVYAYVIDVHPSRSAVFVLVYDHTWGFVCERWSRLFRSCFSCGGGRYEFRLDKKVKDSACVPPKDVLNFLASRA